MPLDEREKKELAKRIKEQRRAMWKGEVATRSRTKKRRDLRGARRVPDHQEEHQEAGQHSESHRETVGEDSVEEHQESEQVSDRQSDEPEARRKDSIAQSNIPPLRLALLVMIGLIAAILIGVAVGYLAAVRDWINM